MIEFECFYKMINYKNISRTLQIIRMFKRMSLTASNKFQAMVKLIPLIPIADYRQRPKACNFIKKETLAQVFSCEFCEISKNTFFTEHLRTTTSERIS